MEAVAHTCVADSLRFSRLQPALQCCLTSCGFAAVDWNGLNGAMSTWSDWSSGCLVM